MERERRAAVDPIHGIMGLFDKFGEKLGEKIGNAFIKHNSNFRYLVDNGYYTEDELLQDINNDIKSNSVAENRRKQERSFRTGVYGHACESCKYGAGYKCYFRSSGNPGYDRNAGSEVLKIRDPFNTTCDCYRWDGITPNP